MWNYTYWQATINIAGRCPCQQASRLFAAFCLPASVISDSSKPGLSIGDLYLNETLFRCMIKLHTKMCKR